MIELKPQKVFVPEMQSMLTTTRRSVHELSASPVQNRTGWAVLALLGGGVLWVARVLTPNSQGFGTHTQLHLPPCAFYAWTHLPCPACGLTTSFAYLADGDLRQAFHAHPVGPVLFALLCGGVVLSVVACALAWPLSSTMAQLKPALVARVLALVLGVAWLVRLAHCLLA
jgi:hypothetical protein